MKKLWNKLVVLLLALLVALSMSTIAQGEETENIPEEGTEGYVEIDLLFGHIDRVDSGMVVIDDLPYLYNKETKYYALSGALAGKSILFPGKFVGYLHDEDTLTEVRLMTAEKEQKRPENEQQTTKKGSSGGGDVYKEDGVWKN